ncbi:MAG: hypothetical protein ACHQT8_00630 [Chlamydiales bacterium]
MKSLEVTPETVGQQVLRLVPRCPLELRLASRNRVLVGGLCGALTPTPAVRFLIAIRSRGLRHALPPHSFVAGPLPVMS